MALTVAVAATSEPTFRAAWDGIRKTRRLGRGHVLYAEGQFSSSLFLLESGLIKLSRSMENGRSAVVRVVRPGEILGDRALLGALEREATAEALCDCTVHEAGREEFLAQCRRRPELWNWVARQLEQRLTEVERRVQLVSFYRVEQRVMFTLADFADVLPDSCQDSVRIPLAQSELAQLVGATRETTSTTLNALSRRGLVRLGRRHVIVPSAAALRLAALDSGAAA